MSPTATALSILSKSKSRRITGEGCVWQLDGNSPEVERCKEELLTAICRECSPYVHYDEECPNDGTHMRYSIEGPGIWRVSRDTSGKELLSWLYMGNWQLYVAAAPLSKLVNLCRASHSEIESFVLESGVSLVIDSFHDETSWTIGLAQNAA